MQGVGLKASRGKRDRNVKKKRKVFNLTAFVIFRELYDLYKLKIIPSPPQVHTYIEPNILVVFLLGDSLSHIYSYD